LAQWFWRKGFLNDPIPFLHFCDIISPLKSLNKLEFPSPKDNLCWFWPAGSGEEDS
jgi:hypothetical protein